MVEQIQDLNLPSAIVQRLIKEALPDNIIISREARLAIGKAASVFAIYLSSAATSEAKKQKHKVVSPKNILDALQEIEFESFVEPVTEALEAFQKINKAKKERAAERKKKTAETATTNNDGTEGGTKEDVPDDGGEMDTEVNSDDENDEVDNEE